MQVLPAVNQLSLPSTDTFAADLQHWPRIVSFLLPLKSIKKHSSQVLPSLDVVFPSVFWHFYWIINKTHNRGNTRAVKRCPEPNWSLKYCNSSHYARRPLPFLRTASFFFLPTIPLCCIHTRFNGDSDLRCDGQRPEPGLFALSSCMAGIGLLKRWQKQNMAQTRTPEGARPSWEQTQERRDEGDWEADRTLSWMFVDRDVRF